jgi:uncharacterized protein
MIARYLGQYINELYLLTNAMAPYLLLGFLFAGILHVFFKKDQVARLLGSKKVRSSIYASLIGVPLPLCSCGVIPTGISIYKSGASKGSTVSFLISTPQTGADSILATYSMLGLPFAILRPVIAFISGIIGGSITNYIDNETDKEPLKVFSEKETVENRNTFFRMFHYAFVESLQDIAKWLIIGLLIAAFIAVILPPEFFQNYIHNDLLGMLIVLAVAVPLYICATGSIPIAAVLLMKGISPGAALVFLMAGPATNAATITVLGKVMGRKALTGYLVSIIGSALFFGLMVDNFLPREWFTSFINGSGHNHSHGLPFWIELSSTILLIIMILNIYIGKIVKRFKEKHHKINTGLQIDDATNQNEYNVVKVKGMDCNNCKINLEKSIGALVGVEEVEANISNSTIKIKARVFDNEKVKKAVEDLGHTYLGIIQKINHKKMDINITVKGMTCNHCKANVEKTIKSLPEISNATVDLDRSLVHVEGDNIDLDEIKKRVEEVGYEYGGIAD